MSDKKTVKPEEFVPKPDTRAMFRRVVFNEKVAGGYVLPISRWVVQIWGPHQQGQDVEVKRADGTSTTVILGGQIKVEPAPRRGGCFHAIYKERFRAVDPAVQRREAEVRELDRLWKL
jgi:hypothetical protein